MARKYKWTEQKYKAVVAGNNGPDLKKFSEFTATEKRKLKEQLFSYGFDRDEYNLDEYSEWTQYQKRKVHDKLKRLEGLRSYYYGFDPKDGFDLSKFDDWTAYQKRKVREHFKRIEILQGQPKRAIHARGKNLKKLQDAFHGDIPSHDMKVALIPDTEPKLTMAGSKKRPPKIKILKEGVSISRDTYERIFIPFDQKALVKNPDKEIARVAKKIPNAKLYYVQVGEYQNLNGKSIGLVIKEIKQWMYLYDGKKPLPNSSGNRGDDPKHHHWKYWLNGLIGYVVPEYIDIRELSRTIKRGRDANKKLTDDRKRYMKRIKRKGRK